jgi:hypothetical protein
MINALVLDFVTESRLKRYKRHSRARVRAAQGGDLSTSADPSSDARRSPQVHPSGVNTNTIDTGDAIRHSVELPIECNPASSGMLSPFVGKTEVGELVASVSAQGPGTSEGYEAFDTRRGGLLSRGELPEGKLGHSTSTNTLHSATPAYPMAAYPPLPSTELHRRSSGKALSIHVDHFQRRGYAHCEYDDQEGHCNCCSEGSSEDDMGDDDDIARTYQSPRLLSFTEALQELGSLQPTPPSPRVRTTTRDTVRAPRRLRWTPRWHQHQREQLSYLKPMQGPPGAGYIGTSRRMSMPLTPDDILLDDFCTTPASPSSPAWGTSARLYGSASDRMPSQYPGQTLLGVLSSTPASPLWTSKGKGVACQSSLESIAYTSESGAHPVFGAVAENRNEHINTPILGE